MDRVPIFAEFQLLFGRRFHVFIWVSHSLISVIQVGTESFQNGIREIESFKFLNE